jgi:type I restriction enzyme S subunit
MQLNGRRLDCNPYLSGAFEARVRLEKLRAKKQPLYELTEGGREGIYHAGREGRTYVDDPDYGVPFLGSTDILASDLSNLALLSKRQVAANPHFTIKEGWTLITRSGTIGRMAYVRSDMAGMACSEHVIRVVPNTDKIPAGYLYAYLSSKFGVPLIVAGTYGAIIQHIEPSHIAELPVPIAPTNVQNEISHLIERASKIRTGANSDFYSAINLFEQYAGLPHLSKHYDNSQVDVSIESSGLLRTRLDGLFHSSYHKTALTPILNLPTNVRTTVAKLASDIIEPTRFKRVQIDETEHGVPFFGTSSIMWNDPAPIYHIPKKTHLLNQYIVDANTLLVPRSGQLSGIIGHIVLPHGDVIGGAVTEDAIRIKVGSQVAAGYLYIALSSEYGRRQIKSRAFGSSIPHLDVRNIGEVAIPKLAPALFEEIGGIGFEVARARDAAIDLERRARQLIQKFVEQG